jgi:hypothetical protein
MSRPDLEARAARAPSRRPAGLTAPILVVGALLLAACSASGGTSPSASATTAAAATATPTATPAAATSTPAATATASTDTTPTVYDPCALVTAAEVTTLTKATFTSGQASDTSDGGKLCAYTQAGVVFEVLVGTFSDAATAQAQEPAFKAQLESGLAQAGVVSPTLTELPGFETNVDAAVVTGSATVQGVTVSAIAIYMLKGAVFVAISDVQIGGTMPTSADMQTQAHTTLSRISG